MRLFIGVPVKRTVALRNLHLELVRWKRHMKVVDQNLYHITLHFLGEVEAEHIPTLTAAMDRVGRRRAPEKVLLKGIGAFPVPERYSVLWVGVEPAAGLTALHDALLEEASLGVPDRAFHPHLSVARHRKGSQERNASGWIDPQREFGSFPVDRLLLVRSELDVSGPIHTILHQSRLFGRERSVGATAPDPAPPAEPGARDHALEP